MMTQSGHRARVDQYGFEKDEEFDHETYDNFMSLYLPVLARRSARWTRAYGDVHIITKSSQMKRFCRKGIPAEFRPKLWMHFSGASHSMSQQPDMYRNLLSSRDKDLSVIESIEMDLHRTFPENIYFCDTSDPSSLLGPLKRVLIAVSHKNPKIGYCQGLNFVVGMLLVIIKDEEKVFWIMENLLNRILPAYYDADMVDLKAEQEFLGELVKWKCTVVADHLNAHGISWMLITTKWFICLFADVLPIETVLRIWDCFFYEGTKVIYRVALSLALLNQDKIIASESFSEIVKTFKEITADKSVVNCHQFMAAIFKAPGSFPRATIDKLRIHCLEEENSKNVT